MKIRFVIACFFVSTLPFVGRSQHMTVGIEGGLVISNVHVSPISVLYGTGAKIKSKVGPKIGGLVNVPIVNRFAMFI